MSLDSPPQTASTLTANLAGIEFSSLLLNASGAFNPHLFGQLIHYGRDLGGIVTKTVTADPLAGNPQSRTVELPGIGMLNSIGLQNPGLAYTLDTELPALAAHGLPVILSISAHSAAEFARMAEAVQAHPHGKTVQALELNLSCPNVEKGGVHFGASADAVRDAVGAVTAVFKRPVFAKLTPNVGDVVPIAAAAVEGGAAGLTAINTVLGAAIDIQKRKAVIPRVSAGYSGPGIKPVALHVIWQLCKHFPDVPILGVGGITNATDVLEFIMAGASVVQVGTSCFRHPLVFRGIREDLEAWCAAEGVASLAALRGCAHPA